MEYSEFTSIFSTACAKNNLPPLSEEQLQTFCQFTNLLMETNQTTNLTAIRNIPEVIYKHYIDSLTVSPLIPPQASVLDLGCGPGFPSIPLSIYRKDLSITSLDSTAKKINFATQSTKTLQLTNLHPITGRAEDLKIRQKLGSFDVVISRAVARLNILCELCLPYVKLGGVLIAMKGAKAQEELVEAQKAIQTLGGKIEEIKTFNLTTEITEEERGLIIIKKTATTPSMYPRAYASILKKPL